MNAVMQLSVLLYAVLVSHRVLRGIYGRCIKFDLKVSLNSNLPERLIIQA